MMQKPLLGIFESLSSGMILNNTDALCIAHTHVVLCLQLTFQGLTAISYRNINYEQNLSNQWCRDNGYAHLFHV